MKSVVNYEGTFTAIIKPVGNACNLKCEYCFYNAKDQFNKTVMGEALLSKFISEYAKTSSGHHFIWHGGEPLLAGIDFYKNVVEIQKRVFGDKPYKNSIQTNATLIDDHWVEFFKKNNFNVGASLDGYRNTHNSLRKNSCGSGSFAAASLGIKKLVQLEILGGVLQVVTKNSLDNSLEDFNYIVDNLGVKSIGLNFFSCVSDSGHHISGYSLSNSDLVEYIKRYTEYWLEKDDPDLRIREIDSFLCSSFDFEIDKCSMSGGCERFICVEKDGKIYACDRLYEYAECYYGDLSRMSLSEIINGKNRNFFIEQYKMINLHCASCVWEKYCHNGCTFHRKGGVKGEYFYCQAMKELFFYFKKLTQDFGVKAANEMEIKSEKRP
jgi:uncharacterized protein